MPHIACLGGRLEPGMVLWPPSCLLTTLTIEHLNTLLTLQKNFGRPIEYELVKEYPWSTPQLRKVDQP